jgi:hypothetical protein
MQYLVAPTTRIVAATVILITGAGIATVFWKMPTGNEVHDLYRAEIVDRTLAATPLPSNSVALLAPGEITLPMLDIAPALDSRVEKYTQVYPAPVSLAALNTEQEKTTTDSPIVEENAETLAPVPVVPQKFEPMRHIVEKPVAIETVSREFQPKPASVSTLEKSDEMLSQLHFARNSMAEADRSSEPVPPVDPFPVAAVAVPSLQPLQPLARNSLSPLLPLQEGELQSLSILSAQ